MSLSSLREYRASPVMASMGPFSICCLMAQYSMNKGSPAHSSGDDCDYPGVYDEGASQRSVLHWG
ncbi:hypothetical protein EYF80_062131 [Liparis tanakae]|uniref:Uncharacterized protein n=1 Tax=Liparis tanakae TaxID=230148 RepID=A0A4Z2EGF5_9TELE|nr:hypothetical protein EYF80_062131 [Liparis tanakae]